MSPSLSVGGLGSGAGAAVFRTACFQIESVDGIVVGVDQVDAANRTVDTDVGLGNGK